ncbi:MAG: sulfite reductase subunit alpha [Planctomycetaceae bacterium]|nr:sulfite reductase subunit alpha [Planctomycetaceae bacterium]
MSEFIPRTAPFTEEQRAWLNGFFSGLMGMQHADSSGISRGGLQAVAEMGMSMSQTATLQAPPDQQDGDDFPWHDPALSLDERMELAQGQPLKRRVMAAMAQLDCGSCGYVCKSYAEALASGEESNQSLCSPGGKDTRQMIKLLLKQDVAEAGGVTDAPLRKEPLDAASPAAEQSGYTRKNPYPARLLESRKLNKQGSEKDVRHVVIDLDGSGMRYEVGDALGVYPVNCSELVMRILDKLGAGEMTPVHSPLGRQVPLFEALSYDCCLRDPSDELLALLASRTGCEIERTALRQWQDQGPPPGFDVLDALEAGSQARITADELMQTLTPLNPRLYSIASSMKHAGSQVHLTVGKVIYESEGRTRRGVASTMLAERMEIGSQVRVFVQPNHGGFTVPQEDSAPMIMVGPGTGIAPFLAFLQERAARQATGRNWLFFGDQRRHCDFLYEAELQEYLQSGVLTRLETAFSRDGEQKVYVQHLMREHAVELWRWLQEGGHFYVCGDAARMARDVERTLLQIIAEQGKINESRARLYLKELTSAGRYVRDVY